MIYLVRHGETAFNRERRVQGHLDSPLTDLGQAQARKVGATLKGLIGGDPGWRIVTSPLGRTRATAEAIRLELGAPAPEEDARLMELSWGEWDGRLRSELDAEHPTLFDGVDWMFRSPTGEGYDALAARLADWLADLAPEPERKLVVVSHGVSGRVLRGLYAGLPRDEALTLEVPQDAVFRLSGGAIERIDCA